MIETSNKIDLLPITSEILNYVSKRLSDLKRYRFYSTFSLLDPNLLISLSSPSNTLLIGTEFIGISCGCNQIWLLSADENFGFLLTDISLSDKITLSVKLYELCSAGYISRQSLDENQWINFIQQL